MFNKKTLTIEASVSKVYSAGSMGRFAAKRTDKMVKICPLFLLYSNLAHLVMYGRIRHRRINLEIH